ASSQKEPALADVFKKQTVRYYTPDGKRCTADTPGASRTVELSHKWYGTVNGKPAPLCRDKGASQKLLNKLLTDATMRAHGMSDPYEEHRKRPLTEHLDDFAAALRAKGDTAKHVELCESRLRAALDGMGAVWLADLDAGKAGDWLTALRTDREPVVLPEGQELFRLAEVAALLGIKPASVTNAVQRSPLPAPCQGQAGRFPPAT